MPVQSDAFIGIKKESAYGTAVVVDQFIEFESETLDWAPTYMTVPTLRPGKRVQSSANRVLVSQNAGGGITAPLMSQSIGILLEAALGTLTNTAVPSATGAYQQVHTPTAADFLPSYTIQKNLYPLGSATAAPQTFTGAQCRSLELQFPAAGIPKIVTDWNAKDVDTATAAATPSYAAGKVPFSFIHGAITIGGTVTPPTTTALATGGTAVANIREATVNWNNNFEDSGHNYGGAGKRSRANAANIATLGGSLSAEYDANTMRDAWKNNTELGLVITLTHTVTIGTGTPVPAAFQVHIPKIFLGGDMPKANGGNVVVQSIPFEGLALPAGVPIYVAYRTLDTAA